MLLAFPDPYPDELLYSALARYARRLRMPSASALARHLVGDDQAVAVVDLPSRLGTLIERMPPGHIYTIDYLIDYHTLLPYYAPFLAIEEVQQIRSLMASTGTNRINAIIGKSSTSIRLPRFMRESTWLHY